MKYIKFFFNNFLKIVSIFLFVCMTFLTIFQVLSRYFLGAPISFTLEVSKFLFIWISFLGCAIVLEENEHICLDLLKNKLSPKWYNFLEIFVSFLIFSFSSVLFFQGIKLVFATINQVTPVTQISMSYIYIVIPISAFFMMLSSGRYVKNKMENITKMKG